MLASTMNNYWVTWFPGAVLAFLGVMALLWKGLLNVTEATRTLKQVRKSLPIIQAEFSPNGGGSMKDRVESLHTKVEALAYDSRKWQREHARDDDRRFAKMEASQERIEDKLAP